MIQLSLLAGFQTKWRTYLTLCFGMIPSPQYLYRSGAFVHVPFLPIKKFFAGEAIKWDSWAKIPLPMLEMLSEA
jgi:hypothetical protein